MCSLTLSLSVTPSDRDSDFTMSLGSPFHCITTLSETHFCSDIQPDPMSLPVILFWCGSTTTEIKKKNNIFIRFSCKQIDVVSAFTVKMKAYCPFQHCLLKLLKYWSYVPGLSFHFLTVWRSSTCSAVCIHKDVHLKQEHVTLTAGSIQHFNFSPRFTDIPSKVWETQLGCYC